MSTITVFTAEENGGCFEFWMPDDECGDYTLSYGDDGSVFCSQKCSKQLVPDGGAELLQIYPVLNNKLICKPKGGGAGGGGGTLAGKDSKHESVSSDLSRLGLICKKPDSGFHDHDDDDDDLHFGFIFDSTTTTDQSFAWVRHTIISHYLGHCLKSMKIPVVQHIGGYGVLYSKTPDLKLSKNGEAPGMYWYLGFPLMEVFSVVIDNNNQGCVLSLYGTISTFDGNRTDCLYKRTREDSESISFSPSGDTTSTTLMLTGPSGPIFVCDSLWIYLDLMVKKDTKDDDDVFYKGNMYWNYFRAFIETCDDDEKGDFTSDKVLDRPHRAFGKPLATTFNGRSGGSVTINYAMLMEGEWADVEITLLNMHGGGGDGAAAAHLYGLIQAGSNCEGVAYWSVLLQKKKENDEYIGVCPGQLIPLSRSLVAVNGFSSLKVSVELYDRLCDTDLSQDDDEIVVKGIVDFPAQTSGMSVENISGCYGEIQVKVTWNN